MASKKVHKRIALHASSLLLLLGGGFLPMPVQTMGQSYSYQVSAKVAAPLPTEAAVITSPSDNQQILQGDNGITVTGTCPDQSYVKVLTNGVISGISTCTNKTFSVRVTLADGTNTLGAQVYNLTDDPGPSSPPITITYQSTQPQPANPAAVPTTLTVSTVDGRTAQNGQQSSARPTFIGYAPPFSKLTVSVHSNVITCTTTANSSGWWACTLPSTLATGTHTVTIVATTPDGRTLQYPTFQITVALSQASPLAMTVPFTFAIRAPGEQWQWSVHVTGGLATHIITIDWGDGQTDRMVHQGEGTLAIAHIYNQEGLYQPFITASDELNYVTYQLAAPVKNKGAVTAATSVFGQFGDLLANVNPWIAWPIFGIVVTSIGAFWAVEVMTASHHLIQRRRARHSNA